MDLSMNQMHEYGNEMLKTVADICEKEKLTYFVAYGSLLGAIRHKGPIPWDYDIDIAVPENELDRFVSIMQKKLPDQYWVDFRNEGIPYLPMPRIGLKGFETQVLHIDVYRVVGFPAKKLAQKWFCFHSRLLVSLRCAKEYEYTGTKRILAKIIRGLTAFIPSNAFPLHFDKYCKRYSYEMSEVIGVNTELPVEKNIFSKDVFDTIQVPYADFTIRIPKSYDAMLRKYYGNYMEFPPETVRKKASEATYHIKPLKQRTRT